MNVFADSTTAATAGVFTFIVIAAVYVWTALALAAVFRKSGEAGWQAWVPILNQIVLFRLGGQSPWLLLLVLIPGPGTIAVWIVQIMACHRIGRDFRVGGGMTVLAALLFPVWASVLGFGSSRWVGEEEEAGPRRTGDTAPPVAPAAQEADPDPVRPAAAPREPIPHPDPVAPIDELPFHARSTHVTAPDPVFSTSSEAVAPPAPAPGRPTPFAPTAPAVEPSSGPVPPRAVRSGSPVPPPAGGWAVPDPEDDAPIDDESDAAPARRRGAYDPTLHGVEDTGEVTGAVEGAPAPLAAVPSSEPPVLPPVTRVPLSESRSTSPEPWAPSRSHTSESDAFAETSGPVSAIAGAPDAGSPRSALSSVSAQNRRPQIPDDSIEETIIARRRRTDWSLVPPSGGPVAIGAEVVLLGRRPTADPAHPGAQLISINDGTVSKTHARLELRDEKWFVTDLNSTNGVVFATLLGTEVEATPGVPIEAGDRFLLGDAEIRLVRSAE